MRRSSSLIDLQRQVNFFFKDPQNPQLPLWFLFFFTDLQFLRNPVSVWIEINLAFSAFTFCSAGTHAHVLLLRNASLLLRNASFLLHALFHLSKHTVHGHHRFIHLYAPFQCKSRNNQCIASCVYCSWLKVLRKTVYKKKLSKQSKRYAVHSNGYFHSQVSAFSLNYQRQNAFNPLQYSVRFLFNVFHLPTNQNAIKTEHNSWWEQT